ncbi:hypothetical protein C8F04DRAFT_1059730 [Mycena alexandri]|uniref:DUF6699 domain-containing protein n=1 Tax=Mycena alexandri TaxID=1745969 RepID=A0AAD6TLV0_9AGAR|nr:hypothetical protein C8F04DRAFT_1059730 [Mycena alexandri]
MDVEMPVIHSYPLGANPPTFLHPTHTTSSSTMPALTRYVQPAGSPPRAFPTPATYPSPTYAYSSSSTSPWPTTTPSPLNHSRPLYAYAPLPSLNAELHPALAPSRHMMALDVSYDPAYATLSPRVLAELATSPGLPCITIVFFRYPSWETTIHPSSSKCPAYVTVADVLNGVYRYLRRQAEPEELETVPPPHMFSAHQALSRRCNELARMDPIAARSEARKGLRRIDFLSGKSRFAGLLQTQDSPDRWQFSVS